MARLDVVTAGDYAEPEAQPAADAPPGSVLARLRERAAAQRADSTLDVPLGGDWEGLLVVRYRMPSMEDADRLTMAQARIGEAAASSGGTAGFGRWSVDVMVTCCDTVLGAAADGTLEDLEERLTGRLLSLLGAPLPTGVDDPLDVTPDEVITRLFGGNWMAINAHAMQVVAWLQGGDLSLGEGSAAT